MSSSAHDLAAQIDGTKERSENLAAEIASDIQLTEDAKNMFLEVGKESGTSMLEQVQSELEEADSIRDAMTGGLEKARWLVMAVITGISAGTTSNSRVTSATYTEKHGNADLQITVNNPVEKASASGDHEQPSLVAKPSPGPRKVDPEADKGLSSFRRAGRIGVRKAGDLQDQGKELTTTFTSATDNFMKSPDQTVASTQQPTAPAIAGPPSHQGPEPGDIVGNSIVLFVMGIEAFSRRRQHRKKNK